MPNGGTLNLSTYGGIAAAFLQDQLSQSSATDSTTFSGAGGSNKNNDPIGPADCVNLGLPASCDTWHWATGNVPAKDDLSNVYAVGNAAGDGARIALLSRAKRREAREAARWVDFVETAVEMEFQNQFVAALNLPHTTDQFPHLGDLLPAEAVESGQHERRRRRRVSEARVPVEAS